MKLDDVYTDPMTAEQFMLEMYALKQWIRHQNFPPPREHLPLPDRLKLELEDLGFSNVRIRPIGPHPVWTFSGRVGTSRLDADWLVRLALAKVARNLGFKSRQREIIVQVAADRVTGAICLDNPVRNAEIAVPAL